jgi:hypothetical protein
MALRLRAEVLGVYENPLNILIGWGHAGLMNVE